MVKTRDLLGNNTLLLIDRILAIPSLEDACYELESYIGREGRRRVSRQSPKQPISVVRFWAITNFPSCTSSIKGNILSEFYGGTIESIPIPTDGTECVFLLP